MKRRTIFLESRPFEVQWEESSTAVQATVNGRSYRLEIRRLDSQTVWLGWNGRSIEACAIARDGRYEVSIQGQKVVVEFRDAVKTRSSRAEGNPGDRVADIRAPMPGKIVRVLLRQEEAVDARQGIVVMEAMKMQNEIRSPRGGRILTLHVSEGDAVNAGDLLARVGD